MDAFFKNVRQSSVKTSSGTWDLPVLYRDASQLGVFFRVDLARARTLLEGTSIEPWPILGAAVAGIFAWEYRDSTLGPYREVGLGIQARRRGTRPSLLRLALDMRAQVDQGFWVANLPVTTEPAYQAGVELWGYPKYITPIETRFSDEGARVRLGDELELSIGRLHGPWKRMPIATYTARGGRLIRTVVEVEHPPRFGSGRSVELKVLGEGPTARSVRQLGLDTARAFAACRSDEFHSILPAGEDIGPAG